METKELEQKKYEYIIEGERIVEDVELSLEWKHYVKQTATGIYGAKIVEASVRCLKALEEGSTFEELEELLHEMSLTDHMQWLVSKTIAKYSERGKAFREFHKREVNQYQTPVLALK